MRFLKSLNYAWQGIKYCVLSERNFRIELVLAFVTFVFAILLKIRPAEWLAILFCIVLVLSLEIINTSIEKLSDVVSAHSHPVIKPVKDMAAGAVFLAALISVIIACIIFFPKVEPYYKYFFK